MAVAYLFDPMCWEYLVSPVSLAWVPPPSREGACRGGDRLMLSHTHSVTLVSHKSQSHTDMVAFVSAVLLTCRAWQNRSGIEQRRRRNFYAWSPTLHSIDC